MHTKISKVFIGLILLMLSSSAFAQWSWSATDIFGTYNGNAPNKVQAESEMRAACEACKHFTKEVFINDAFNLQYSYLPEPEWLEPEYSEWEYLDAPPWFAQGLSSLSEVLNAIEDSYQSSLECPSTSLEVNLGGLFNYNVLPIVPPTAEIYCNGLLTAYNGITNSCSSNDPHVTVNYYNYNTFDKTCNFGSTELGSFSRFRDVSCIESYTVLSTIYEPDVINAVSQKHVCEIKQSGDIIGPYNGSDCDGDIDTTVGNPCSPMTGAKLKSKQDYLGNELSFYRRYNSIRTVYNSDIGKNWRHNYDDTLSIDTNGYVRGWMSSGNVYVHLSGNVPPYTSGTPSYSQIDRIVDIDRVERISDEWIMDMTTGDKRIFDLDGWLIRTETNDGRVTTLDYDEGKLISVTNHFGNQLQFIYQDDLVSELIQPDGQSIDYGYDGVGNLITVTYPDTGQGNGDTITYHYEDTRFPFHLTGITDENGDRHQTYTYNADGKVISSEKAQTSNTEAQEKFELDYLN